MSHSFPSAVVSANVNNIDACKVRSRAAHRAVKTSVAFAEATISLMLSQEKALYKKRARRGAPSMNSKSFADAVYEILFSSNGPLTVDEIADKLSHDGYVTRNKCGLPSVVMVTLQQGKREGWAFKDTAKKNRSTLWFNLLANLYLFLYSFIYQTFSAHKEKQRCS